MLNIVFLHAFIQIQILDNGILNKSKILGTQYFSNFLSFRSTESNWARLRWTGISESVSICHHRGCLCIYIFVFICVNKSVHLCHHLGQLCLFSKGERSANSDEGLWSSSSWKQPRHNQHPCLELRYVKVRLFQHFHPAKIRRAARKYESCRCSAVRLKRA